MKNAIYLLLFLFPIVLQGQKNQQKKQLIEPGKLEFRLGYFGNNLWNPGMIFTPEYTLKEFAKSKRGKSKLHQVVLNANLGFFLNPQTHTGTFTSLGVAYRKTTNRKFQYTVGLNPLGYYRSFLHETYEVSDEGTVTENSLASIGYAAPSFIIGIGKDKSKKNWFLNLHFMLLNNYNIGNQRLGSIEFGYRFGR